MKDQVLNILRFLRDVLLIDLAIFVVVALSFLFSGGFAFQAYSDRLLWAGIAAILVGGVVGIGGGLGAAAREGYDRARASVETAPERAAPKKSDRYAERKHHTFAFLCWAVGLLCVAASAIVSILLGTK